MNQIKNGLVSLGVIACVVMMVSPGAPAEQNAKKRAKSKLLIQVEPDLELRFAINEVKEDEFVVDVLLVNHGSEPFDFPVYLNFEQYSGTDAFARYVWHDDEAIGDPVGDTRPYGVQPMSYLTMPNYSSSNYVPGKIKVVPGGEQVRFYRISVDRKPSERTYVMCTLCLAGQQRNNGAEAALLLRSNTVSDIPVEP